MTYEIKAWDWSVRDVINLTADSKPSLDRTLDMLKKHGQTYQNIIVTEVPA